jgi:hypothetical protein
MAKRHMLTSPQRGRIKPTPFGHPQCPGAAEQIAVRGRLSVCVPHGCPVESEYDGTCNGFTPAYKTS